MENHSEKTIKNSKSKIILHSNKGTEELNVSKRELLKKRLKKESKIVSENSMEILSEFERF